MKGQGPGAASLLRTRPGCLAGSLDCACAEHTCLSGAAGPDFEKRERRYFPVLEETPQETMLWRGMGTPAASGGFLGSPCVPGISRAAFG